MYSQQKGGDHFWKYKARTRVDSIDRYPNKPKRPQHMSPMDVLKEYCDKASLHGVRYTMRGGAPTYDRLSWVITLVICATFAGLFVNTALVNYRSSPTVTSVETTHLPLYKVPFPAITICPASKINKTKGMELLIEYLELTSVNASMEMELIHVMSALSMLQHPFYDRMVPHLQDIPDPQQYDNLNVTWFMLKVLPTCQEIFHSCFWLGRGADCCDVFKLQRSENGFCYSFNSLTSETGKLCPPWEELEADGVEHVARETSRECQLRRNTGAGTTTGLEVFLKASSNATRLPMGQRDLNGARVLIHHPSQFPEAGKGLFLPEVEGDVFTVKVSPAMTVTSDAVRSLAPSERNCIFPDERQLNIYQTYTQPGCLTECRIKFIAQECGCTPYYFEIQHDQYKECSLSQFWCIANHSLDLRFFRPPKGTRGFSEWSNLDCLHCLPTCHETVYNLESSLSQDNNPALSTSKGYLDVYYKDLGVVKYRRTLMFDKMQLIVAFGGIASLFLGVSLLTVVELFYYLVKLVISVYYQATLWRTKQQYSSTTTPPGAT